MLDANETKDQDFPVENSSLHMADAETENPDEDIDEAAFMYVTGHGEHQETESETELGKHGEAEDDRDDDFVTVIDDADGSTETDVTPSDDFSDYVEGEGSVVDYGSADGFADDDGYGTFPAPTTEADGFASIPDGGTTSWRESVQSEGATEFKQERTTERNMKLMSDLWNRLFPIDYDAIPVAAYVPAEGEVAQIPTVAPQEGTHMAPADETGVVEFFDGQSVAGAATVAGLGGAAILVAGEVDRQGRRILQSDTSNDDTVMIGNSALSEMLSNHGDEPSVTYPTDGFEDVVPESAPKEELPEELSNLYDEAMSMFADTDEETGQEVEPESALGGEGVEDAPIDEALDENRLNDETDDIDENVVAPADAETIDGETDDYDYRGDTGSTNIYESEEWLQIEREIEETNRAVATGLDQLDVLAHVGTDDHDEQPENEIATPESNVDGEPTSGASDEASDETSDAAYDLGHELGGQPEQEFQPVDANEATEEKHKRGIFGRIANLFHRQVLDEPAVTEAAQDTSDMVSWEVLTGDTEAESASAYASEGTDGEFDEAASDDTASETVATTETDAVVADSPDEPESQADLSDTALWGGEDLSDFVEVGDDYRATTSRDEKMPESAPFETSELITDGDDDDLIPMGDDESQDYRAETAEASSVSEPTMPMSPEEFDAVEDATSQPAMTEAQPSVPATDESAAQGLATHRESTRRIDKARLRSLQIDASPEFMLPLPTSRNGQIDANIRVKTTEFLNPKRSGNGKRSSYIKLSVRPSKVKMGSVAVLPEGSGYIPEASPMGTRMREQASYEYEPIRRIGEPLEA